MSVTCKQSLCSQFSPMAAELPWTVVHSVPCTTVSGSLVHQIHLWNLKNTYFPRPISGDSGTVDLSWNPMCESKAWARFRSTENISSTYLGETPEISGHQAPLPVASRPQNEGEYSGGGCICTLPRPPSPDTWWVEHWTGWSFLKKKHPRGLHRKVSPAFCPLSPCYKPTIYLPFS